MPHKITGGTAGQRPIFFVGRPQIEDGTCDGTNVSIVPTRTPSKLISAIPPSPPTSPINATPVPWHRALIVEPGMALTEIEPLSQPGKYPWSTSLFQGLSPSRCHPSSLYSNRELLL